MRRTAAYLFHLAIATLTIPIVALNLGALLYRLTNKALSPQQFYSDHLFSLIGCTGVLLAYLVSSTFANREAMWVWVPARMVNKIDRFEKAGLAASASLFFTSTLASI